MSRKLNITSLARLPAYGLHRAAGLVLISMGLTVLAGCQGAEMQTICTSGPKVVRVVAMSSVSDLGLARRMTPELSPVIAVVAAEHCAKLQTGIATNNPNNLVLQPTALTPSRDKAPKRGPYIRNLTDDASAAITEHLTPQLDSQAPTSGSPVFGTLKAIAGQARAAGDASVCTVTAIVTDAYAIERIGRHDINLYRSHFDKRALDALARDLAPALKPLAGGVVVLVGAGGGNSDTDRAANAEKVIRHVLDAADIELVWSRGVDFKATCPP